MVYAFHVERLWIENSDFGSENAISSVRGDQD